MVEHARFSPTPSAAPAKIRPAAPQAARDIRDTTLVKYRDLFLLADLEGNVPARNPNGLGLYHGDTRFLSAFDLRVEGLRPIILLSSGRWPFLSSYVLTNPSLVTEDGRTIYEQSIQIRRHRLARAQRVSESLAFRNLNPFPLTIAVAVHVEADFADIFEVRGAVTGAEAHAPQVESTPRSIAFRHDGRDGIRRATHVAFDPAPTDLRGGTAFYRLELDARGEQRFSIEIELDPGEPPRAQARGTTVGSEEVSVQTSNARFDAALAQARSDLTMLLSGDDEAPFIAAGIPWYSALFGRDSIITALEQLWLAPALARHTLVMLAHAQGRREDPARDEEPGKILHEQRRGEAANVGLVPFGRYFGSVDATPLWIFLLGAYHRATGDLALVRELAPNLDAALRWIDVYGDRDGDGFVEYQSRASGGLSNQGWKDSWDGIVDADGSLAEPPIALVEVQAYVYTAKRRAARLFRLLGDEARGDALEAQAQRLRERFEAAFWMPSEGMYCLGLDGKKRQLAVASSNAGHALFAGIASPDHAARTIDRLMSEDLFSGWGVRTLSNREVRYNPVGYHLGTVWPHDNALIAFGMKRYGAEAQLVELATGLFDAVAHFPSMRMPELFCGFARSAFGEPVRYPVACSPQAWAAASLSFVLQSLLGLRADAAARELTIVRPMLPPWLQWVRLDHVRVGEGDADLRYERVGDRTAVDVLAMRGGVRVTFVDSWPPG